jgi:hypothetical protein
MAKLFADATCEYMYVHRCAHTRHAMTGSSQTDTQQGIEDRVDFVIKVLFRTSHLDCQPGDYSSHFCRHKSLHSHALTVLAAQSLRLSDGSEDGRANAAFSPPATSPMSSQDGSGSLLISKLAANDCSNASHHESACFYKQS